MFKNFFLIILLVLTTSCGYDTIHSKSKKSNYDFSIEKVDFKGDREINIKIKQNLNNYISKKEIKNYALKIKSKSTKKVVARDSKGNPSIYNLEVQVLVKIMEKNTIKEKIQLSKNYSYDYNIDTFELRRYEKKIKINLTETITKSLIFKLSNY